LFYIIHPLNFDIIFDFVNNNFPFFLDNELENF